MDRKALHLNITFDTVKGQAIELGSSPLEHRMRFDDAGAEKIWEPAYERRLMLQLLRNGFLK
jgi:hypothetical protein